MARPLEVEVVLQHLNSKQLSELLAVLNKNTYYYLIRTSSDNTYSTVGFNADHINHLTKIFALNAAEIMQQLVADDRLIKAFCLSSEFCFKYSGTLNIDQVNQTIGGMSYLFGDQVHPKLIADHIRERLTIDQLEEAIESSFGPSHSSYLSSLVLLLYDDKFRQIYIEGQQLTLYPEARSGLYCYQH